eukprot:COSAG01_NODE_5138_length_4460_cov_2.442559_3_plen_533_part_00
MGCAQSTTAVQQVRNEEVKGGLVEVVPSEGPHQGAEQPQDRTQQEQDKVSKEREEVFTKLFRGKHAMLSYQLDVQQQVKAVRELLKAQGIPTWMHTDGYGNLYATVCSSARVMSHPPCINLYQYHVLPVSALPPCACRDMQTDFHDSMAEGVTGAAVIVPFMTEKYQTSENCALELKRAKKCGVPIVPVMMQGGGWSSSGWLGLITAGTLWTPLYDKAALQAGVQGLAHQIELVLQGPDSQQSAGDTQEKPDAFSTNDLRDEPATSPPVGTVAKASVRAVAKISASIPHLPRGVLVTEAMTESLKILTDTTISRIGFYGIGGIGKSVILSWLVRHDIVRQKFNEIVWVTLGQTPDAALVQSVAFSQLTGASFKSEISQEQRSPALQQAMQNKNLLLVLDDIWDRSHEELLNFVDEGSGAKVLLSSRVRGVLDSNSSMGSMDNDAPINESIIDIGVPSEDDATKMLLAVADLSIDGELPTEVIELVRFCKMLPLSIARAGKLLKEVDIQEADDWDGVVEMLKDEFAESDDAAP